MDTSGLVLMASAGVLCVFPLYEEVALGGSRLHSKHTIVKSEPNRARFIVKCCLDDPLSSSECRWIGGSRVPQDSIDATRPEEMSEIRDAIAARNADTGRERISLEDRSSRRKCAYAPLLGPEADMRKDDTAEA